MNLQPLILSLAVIGCCVTALWLLSLRLRDVSIADVWWAPGFAVIAWVAPPSGLDSSPRMVLLQVLLSIWAVRLALHIGRRGHGQPEDKRYQEMRRSSEAFWLVSLVKVFWLQGLLQCLVALPIYAVALSTQPLGTLDHVGLVIASVGIAVEAIADLQLRRFTGDPANASTVMDRGLWGWSRHPNYFGNAVLWGGVGLVGLGAGGPLWTLVGPAVMLTLLLRVSGVSLLESTIVDRRPEYASYIERVSPFFPLPPKS